MSTRATPIFKNLNVAKEMSDINNKYVVVPTNKALNNIVFEFD